MSDVGVESKRIKVDNNASVARDDLWLMFLSTVRYSMGRMTYMPETCRELYKNYSCVLTLQQKRQLAEEIETELLTRKSLGKTLGMQCDHDTWKYFVGEIHEDMASQKDESLG